MVTYRKMIPAIQPRHKINDRVQVRSVMVDTDGKFWHIAFDGIRRTF